MKNILTIFLLFLSLNVISQELYELVKDLAYTDITETKKIEKKAKKVFKIDPFNDIAVRFLIDSYQYANKESPVKEFFQKLKTSYPNSPSPYLLSARYQFNDCSIADTSIIIELKKAVEIEPNNYEANKLLAFYYYDLFNERINIDSISKPNYYAEKSQNHFLKTICIDSTSAEVYKHPLIQLSYFLGNLDQASHFTNLKSHPRVDKENFPVGKRLQYYFPSDCFIELPDKWQTNYTEHILHIIYRDIFPLSNPSNELRFLKEPLLYNQSNDSSFRFIWIRSFNNTISIRIKKSHNNILLTLKTLDNTQGPVRDENIIEKTKALTIQEWTDFQEKLAKSDFWNLSTLKKKKMNGYILDGTEWIIEGNANGQYHVVKRKNPEKSGFKEIGIILIKLSGLEIKDDELH